MTTPLESQEQESDTAKRIEWRVQRLGWVAMALIVVLALAGLFGPGPVSWSTASAPDGTLEVSYSRFLRRGASGDLTLQIPAAATAAGEVEVVFSSEYLDSLEVEAISPEPDSQTTTADGVVFTFAVDERSPLAVSLEATAGALGVRQGRIGVVGATPAEFWQVFYP